jgi:hypothetical protein
VARPRLMGGHAGVRSNLGALLLARGRAVSRGGRDVMVGKTYKRRTKEQSG